MSRARIAIPGQLTTATLLLRLFAPAAENFEVMVFDEIIPAVAEGKVDAGLIIHESRFTYQEHGLVQVVDLGEWWEESTGHPIPLGGILAKRDLGAEMIRLIDASLKASVEYAYDNPDLIKPYIRDHAQEMDEAVMQQHIDLYVNEYSIDYGEDGEAAIKDLLDRAVCAGIVPDSEESIFVD